MKRLADGIPRELGGLKGPNVAVAGGMEAPGAPAAAAAPAAGGAPPPDREYGRSACVARVAVAAFANAPMPPLPPQ